MKLKSVAVKFEDGKELCLDLTASVHYDWNSHLIDGNVVKNSLVFSGMNPPLVIGNSHQEFKFNLIGYDGNEVSFSVNVMNGDQVPSECKGFFNGIRMFDQMDKQGMGVCWNTFMHMAILD